MGLERLQQTSREYRPSRGLRHAVDATSEPVPIPDTMLGETREVRIVANTRCFLRFGDSAVAASNAGTSIPIVADAPEVMVVPASATHFAVVQDSAGGFLTLTPVA